MATMLKTGQVLARAACLAVLFAIVCTMGSAQSPQSAPVTITLTGQSMIRSDIRATAPAAVPVIQGLLKGDVVFTNFEATVAEKSETVHEGRGFLTPPEALDALTTFGFNLLSLSGNHAFDLKVTGIQNTIREGIRPASTLDDALFLKVNLAAPVPKDGEARIRIYKVYEDAPSYFAQGDRLVFDRPLGIRRIRNASFKAFVPPASTQTS